MHRQMTWRCGDGGQVTAHAITAFRPRRPRRRGSATWTSRDRTRSPPPAAEFGIDKPAPLDFFLPPDDHHVPPIRRAKLDRHDQERAPNSGSPYNSADAKLRESHAGSRDRWVFRSFESLLPLHGQTIVVWFAHAVPDDGAGCDRPQPPEGWHRGAECICLLVRDRPQAIDGDKDDVLDRAALHRRDGERRRSRRAARADKRGDETRSLHKPALRSSQGRKSPSRRALEVELLARSRASPPSSSPSDHRCRTCAGAPRSRRARSRGGSLA